MTCPTVKQCIGASLECFRKSSSTNAKQCRNFLRKNNHYFTFSKIAKNICMHVLTVL